MTAAEPSLWHVLIDNLPGILTALGTAIGLLIKAANDKRVQALKDRARDDRITDLETHNNEQTITITRQQKQIETMANDYRDLLARFEEAVKTASAEQDEAAALREMLTKSIADVDRLEEAYKALHEKYRELIDKNTVLEARYQTLDANYKLLSKQYDDVCREYEALKARVNNAVKKQTGGLPK